MSGATAIVLARAGSKGLPGKNTRPVAGRPCVAWTIEHAQRSAAVARVVVSSDDPAVIKTARAVGADAHDREPEFCTDAATVDAAARSAVEAMRVGGGPVVILYANVPARPTDLTDRAVRTLLETGADSVQSYAPAGKHHPWWTAVVGERGEVRPWQGDVLNHGVFRRQDLPPAHVPDGGVIALTLDALLLRVPGVPPGPHAFFGADRRGVETAPGEVVDIDTEADLLVADATLRLAQRRAAGAAEAHARDTA